MRKCYMCGRTIPIGETVNLKLSRIMKREVRSQGWYYITYDKEKKPYTKYHPPKTTNQLAPTTIDSYSLCPNCAEEIIAVIKTKRRQSK